MHLQQGKRANQVLAFGGGKLFLICNAGIRDVCVFPPSSHVTGKIKKTEFKGTINMKHFKQNVLIAFVLDFKIQSFQIKHRTHRTPMSQNTP